MAQLNDLLVLGKSSLLGELKVSSDIIAPQLILETSSGEGGQIQLKTALNDLTNSGILIDTANGDFRIFGLPSRNGSTRTGNGTVLTIDPYDKTINGGYSFDGVSARTQKIETWYSDKSRTYGASYPLYAWWETNSECRLTVDNYTVKVNYADTSGLANSVAWGNVTGKPSSYPPSNHTHDFITYKDTRNDNQTPDNLQAGVTIHLKGNNIDGLNDGGSYHPILAFKDWHDYSGGPYGQITTTANQNLYFRASTSGTTWGSWYKVAIQNKDNTFSGTNTFNGYISSSVGFQVQRTNGDGYGLGLYGTSAHNSYGIHMSKTATYGTHGPVTSDWATYFCFDGANTRGWIFKHAGTNVASISGTGQAKFDDTVFGYAYTKNNNKAAFMWDKPGSNCTGVGANGTSDTIYFGACTTGGEWVTSYKQKWVFNGQITSNGKALVGSYQANATTVPNLVEEVRYSNGCMGSVSIGTAYTASTGGTIATGWYNFVYTPHRSGGANGAADGDNCNYGTLILYGMTIGSAHWRIRVQGGSIVESRRIWNAGDSITSAVWNDYAEYRESDCEDFGYVLCEKGDDSLTKTTERLSHFAGVSSDTWGFSQGKTDRATTPIAVAGRVLVYPYQNKNNYKPGDCVCAAPGGTVDIMTREEIINWPDRIVGIVSCVPEYEEWGGGELADRSAVKVNNRIWIKIK